MGCKGEHTGANSDHVDRANPVWDFMLLLDIGVGGDQRDKAARKAYHELTYMLNLLRLNGNITDYVLTPPDEFCEEDGSYGQPYRAEHFEDRRRDLRRFHPNWNIS